MPTIDVIGDIHGYADKLRRLLNCLGYEQSRGVYLHPDRGGKLGSRLNKQHFISTFYSGQRVLRGEQEVTSLKGATVSLAPL